MDRLAMKELLKWKETKQRKPLLVTGMRQCGKTYLIQSFGSRYFSGMAYFSFEEEPEIASVFKKDLNPDRIIRELSQLYYFPNFDISNTLIVFDEIQECPEAITSLKYFCESKNDYYLIAAGSLLGVEIKRKGVSFPVGKISRLQMFPLSFFEFVYNSEKKNILDYLKEAAPWQKLPDVVMSDMFSLLKQYYIVGGMPAAVQAWFETQDYTAADSLLDDILADFRDDFSKHASSRDIPKLSQIWDSIPKQLAKDNRKFMFSHVKKGARARDLEDALQWLKDAGLVYTLERTETSLIPLSAFSDNTVFKVYMADVGLLRRTARIDFRTILTEPDGYDQFKGAMTENYAMSELKAQGKYPYYWTSGNTAELDFVIENKDEIVPIEIKSANRTKAKSLAIYCKQYHPRVAFKFSGKNIGLNQKCETSEADLPLFLLWNLDRYLA